MQDLPSIHPELERRLRSCPTLPSLPAVAFDVLRLCRDEDVDLRKVGEALSSDPALSARVLRAANSTSIAARSRVATLTRAVALLGSSATVAIALSFSLVRGRRRGDPAGLDHGAFWRRAVISGIAARILAEREPCRADPEEAALAALLQDLGMLALSEMYHEEYGSMCAEARGDHDALALHERERWGADHAQVSALLARCWALPPRLQEALAGSHGEPAPSAQGASLACCACLSSRLADVWVGGGTGAALEEALERVRERLGVGREALSTILAQMAVAIPEAAADFDLDLGGEDRVEQVLGEAQRVAAARAVGGGGGGGALASRMALGAPEALS